jgi:hypothetical protein
MAEKRAIVTDADIKTQGMKALIGALGEVNAERFVTLLMRDRFDYTEWQKGLWPDRSVREIGQAAANRAENRC